MFSDDERRLWVLNDEGLYNLWQASGEEDARTWVEGHRTTVDNYIQRVLNGDKPAHFGTYGG